MNIDDDPVIAWEIPLFLVAMFLAFLVLHAAIGIMEERVNAPPTIQRGDSLAH